MQTYLVLGLIFAVGVAVFAVQNAFRVDVDFFFWRLEQVSLVVVIFGSALVGAAATALFGVVKQIKQGVSLRKSKAEVDSLTTEIGLLQAKFDELQKRENEMPSEKEPQAEESEGANSARSANS